MERLLSLAALLFMSTCTWTLCLCTFDHELKRLSAPQAVEKGTRWLMSKRHEDWGWGGSDTSDVIVTLQLTNRSWFSDSNLESQLSAKQLELETALAIWSRHHENPIRPGRIAKFVNGLLAVCKDPSSFYGHDLVAMMQHLDTGHPFEYAYVTLTLCNAGIHIRKKQIRRLVNFIGAEDVHNYDTVSMAVMAISCIAKEHRSRNLLNYSRRPAKKLKKLQQEDGSFGNIHTSALITQALISLEGEQDDWNFTKAVEYFLSQQQADGSFGNLAATTSVLPILAGQSYDHIFNTTCEPSDEINQPINGQALISVSSTAVAATMAMNGVGGSTTTTSTTLPPPHLGSTQIISNAVNASTSSPPQFREPKMITVTYSIWIGNNITENHTLSIKVPANTSFYDIMNKASKMNEKFEFTASLWPNGHYVQMLAGLKEDRVDNQYWLLCLNNKGNENPAFVDTGVDDYYPQDGDNIIFWYKKI